MGFLDKMKAAKNFVTGGGAKVAIQVGEGKLGGTVPVRISAEISSADLSVSKVYVRARAEEIIKMTVIDQDDHGDKDKINENSETFDQTFDVTGPLNLEAGSRHEWTADIQIPASAEPTYRGRNARHVWRFQAGLDVKGNDPDSGWTEVTLR
jgi:hypothetical protein